jgi:hypothetical protein
MPRPKKSRTVVDLRALEKRIAELQFHIDHVDAYKDTVTRLEQVRDTITAGLDELMQSPAPKRRGGWPKGKKRGPRKSSLSARGRELRGGGVRNGRRRSARKRAAGRRES